MHPDLASLLRYARRYPDDDVARRVIADWLEENGDQDGRARAEFIRVQLALASEPPDSDRRASLTAVARRLRLEHLHYWLGPFAEVLGVVGAEFERGMMRLALSSDVLDYGLERLASLPEWAWVDGVVNEEGWEALARELVGSPILAELRHLALKNADLSAGVERLAGNPAAAGLLTLDLSNCRWWHETAPESLARSAFLAGLRRLVLVGTWVTEKHWQQLRARFGERVVLPEPSEVPF